MRASSTKQSNESNATQNTSLLTHKELQSLLIFFYCFYQIEQENYSFLPLWFGSFLYTLFSKDAQKFAFSTLSVLFLLSIEAKMPTIISALVTNLLIKDAFLMHSKISTTKKISSETAGKSQQELILSIAQIAYFLIFLYNLTNKDNVMYSSADLILSLLLKSVSLSYSPFADFHSVHAAIAIFRTLLNPQRTNEEYNQLILDGVSMIGLNSSYKNGMSFFSFKTDTNKNENENVTSLNRK